MKMVIDIPDDIYSAIVKQYRKDKELQTRDNLYKSIANGIPLSKVIDRIIDSIETEASWECFDEYGNITGEWDSIRNVILRYRK